MPISMPSASSALPIRLTGPGSTALASTGRAAAGLAPTTMAITGLILSGMLIATLTFAQENGRAAISGEGSDAMDRLRRAITAGQERSSADAEPHSPGEDQPHPHLRPHPVLPDIASPDARRRAFEGLHRRRPSPALEERARTAQREGEAALARERERQAKALRQALGLEPSEEQALARADAPRTDRSPAVSGRVPVLFVSASMPVAVLRTYAAQLERAHGVLALRGMPGGMKRAGPMAKLAAEILRRDPGCEGPACLMRDVQLIVDPLVFRQHGIERVPALAMLPGDPAQPYCERDEESPRSAHVVYGDSALSGLLEEYARLGGKEEVRHAQALLRAL